MMLHRNFLLPFLATFLYLSPSLAQDTSSVSNVTPTPTAPGSSSSNGGATLSSNPSSSVREPSPASSSGTGSASATGSGSSSSPSPTSIDGQPGRLTLTEPAVTYPNVPMLKIGAQIQLKWTFNQYLTIPPQALNINVVRPSLNLEIPIAVNLTGTTTSWIWDTTTWNQTNAPLVEGSDYSFRFFDERGPKADWVAGRLAMTQISFKMYIPANGPVCTACLSSAVTQQGSTAFAGALSILALATLL
ncbi:hypothetical protein K493DRAFT_341059 [Basidiobolus meristosporus CBS 931.73]|uniref:DUF7137 domain-containing protein n=1 Tax=Basidiobolus meristosporus CBS 931.73 TaxID=1314790 RepID=A0A1Y1XSR3_9FUNG|nr:hypothetical protein K493DRAFT_341059 [Basidiobolus meristosporus CBS 931.73]|eukprot:ORX88799.1 hypothetical protein K493DRAFT_341059 [Basidiobolus meristosporus CBS 931.73]